MATLTHADIIHAYVSQQRAKGLSISEIKEALAKENFEDEMNTVQLQKNKINELNDAASKHMTEGALFVFAGILIALFTYLTAIPNSVYTLTYTSLFVGCVKFIKGYMQSV